MFTLRSLRRRAGAQTHRVGPILFSISTKTDREKAKWAAAVTTENALSPVNGGGKSCAV